MIKSKSLFQTEVDEIASSNKSQSELAEIYGVSKRTIDRIRQGMVEGMPDEKFDVSEIKLQYKLQRTRERSSRERKVSRETFRVADLIQSLQQELIDTIEQSEISVFETQHHKRRDDSKVVGVIQLSDLHFGERVTEVDGNEFNFETASRRLRKLAEKARIQFNANDVSHVVIAITGDLVNSDRRLDEITSNANNRAKVVFTSVELLKQFIQDINQGWNVTVASICGNESRINKNLGWVDFMAYDNFDAIIHFFLQFIFKDKEGVDILEMDNPLEKVIDANGHHICLIHGHTGLSNNAAMESKVAQLKAKYASKGVIVDYVLSGHIHECRISDTYARSASLVGANAYSDKALGLISKASQNIYIVTQEEINGMRIDLQHCKQYEPYRFDESNDVYMKHKEVSNVVIQKILK